MKRTLMSICGLLLAFVIIITADKLFGTRNAETESNSADKTTVAISDNQITEESDDVSAPPGSAWDAVKFSDYEEFSGQLGVTMPLPDETGDTDYVILRQNIGHIEFSIGAIEYTYRCASHISGITGEDLHGIPDSEFEPGDTFEDLNSVSVRFRCTSDGDILAEWSTNDANFSLAVPSEERGSISGMIQVIRQILSA